MLPASRLRRFDCQLPSITSLQSLRLFLERRIAVPVDDDALVLYIGCGEKSSWRADVLLDRFTGPSMRVNGPAGAQPA